MKDAIRLVLMVSSEARSVRVGGGDECVRLGRVVEFPFVGEGSPFILKNTDVKARKWLEFLTVLFACQQRHRD